MIRTSEASMQNKIRNASIFIVEDESDIQEVMEYNLAREGFKVSCSSDGEDGLVRIRRERPNLVVLDLMLPGQDGLEVCRSLRADEGTRKIPIIMVTAKGEESDIVLGLGLGADDYITKPFSPKELVARVQAVLRRSMTSGTEEPAEQRVQARGVEIDPASHEVSVDGVPIEFTATEFRLLYYMASRPGRVFTREQLVRRVIGEDVVVLDRNIDVHVRSIRKKLGEHRNLLKTIRGVGYRWVEGTG